MSTTEAVKSSKEYMNVPIAELIESSTNPRKVFDEERLEELAESIRSKGVLSPLLVRRVNNHFGNCYGGTALPCRAASRVGRNPGPALEHSPMRRPLKFKSSKIFNASDVHPFEEAQGFRALLGQRRCELHH